MESKTKLLIIGIGGRVLGIDPATGTEVWRTKLKGSDTVTVSTIGERIFAGTSGELFCLDSADGGLLWHNKLKGLGIDIVAFSGTDGSSSIAARVSKRRMVEAAATAT